VKSVDGLCKISNKYKGPEGETWPTVFAAVPHAHSFVSSDRGTLGRVINIEHAMRSKQPFIIVILEVLKK